MSLHDISLTRDEIVALQLAIMERKERLKARMELLRDSKVDPGCLAATHAENAALVGAWFALKEAGVLTWPVRP